MESVYYLLDILKVSQTWGALHKCWVGFVIAKEKMEWDKIDLYAKRIQNLERE
jgi:phage head maturation protease